MKKSIFLFFAAILCAMSVSAKVIYFKPNGNWAQANANFYAHVWGGSGATSPVKFTPVATDPDVYEAEIGTHNEVIFLRHDPAKTVTSSNMWDCWNRMGNLSIPTDGKNCCTINDNQWSQEKNTTNGAASYVTWSTYTPPTEVVIPDRYITGTIAGGWNANDVKMTYDEATETYSHTFTAVAAGELHQFKVTDGTWSKNWGGDAVSPAIEGVTTGSDGNVAFTLSTGGDVTITFDGSHIQLTTTGSFTPVETFDYYVVGSFNGWNTADPAYGMTKDGDVYKKEVTFAAAVQFKVCKGSWDAGAWGANNLGDNKYKELGGTDNLEMKEEKTFTIIFNPSENLITFEGLTPEAVVKYDYYLIGTINGWTTKDENFGMTDEDADGVYEKEVTLAAGDNEIKVNNGTWDDGCHWGFGDLAVTYEETDNKDGNIKITVAAEKTITVKFDKNEKKITLDGLTPYVAPLTYTVTVPAGTEKCYIAGNMNNWAFQEMETVTGETNKFTITIVGAKETDEYKYACQADWAYAEVIEGGGNRTAWQELDQVEEWGKPVIVTYQLKGVGGWEQPGIELVQNPENDKEYMLTCQAISAEDAIKVVRLEDGVIKDYYGNGTVKDGVEVTVSYDIDGNITLPEGNYNFYFDTAEPEKKLWIAAATDCEAGEEIGDIIELTMTNLVVTPMDGDIELLEASENTFNISVTLGVDADGNLIEGSNVTKDGETELPINYNRSGKFTKSTDAENGDVYSGLVVVEFDGGLIGLQLTMYASTIEVTKVNLTGGTVTLNEEGAYVMSAKWDTEDVIVELSALEMEDKWVSILIGEDPRVLSGYATVTNQGEIVTLEANGLQEWDAEWTQVIAIYDITITATLDLQNVTVYFINTPKWNTPIYAYATKKTGWGRNPVVTAENAPSPGVVATKEDYQIAGYDVYSYTALEGTYNKVQFSGNEVATDEAGWESDMYYIHNFDGNSGWYTKAEAETLLTPDPEETPDYTRTVEENQWGTICLPNASSSFTGATFYEVSSLDPEKGLWLDQLAAGTQLVAGKPYIFYATATEITVTYTDAAPADAPQAGENGLTGTFTGIAADSVLVGNYIIADNKVWVAGASATLPANRAYINAEQVPTETQAEIPGRRRVCMGENATTGFDQIVAPAGQAVKIIENGQLIIIRDGVKYNVQGQVIR